VVMRAEGCFSLLSGGPGLIIGISGSGGSVWGCDACGEGVRMYSMALMVAIIVLLRYLGEIVMAWFVCYAMLHLACTSRCLSCLHHSPQHRGFAQDD